MSSAQDDLLRQIAEQTFSAAENGTFSPAENGTFSVAVDTSFRFTPQRPLVWYGYRSDEGDSTPDVGDTTAANTPLEIDLWQAGGETHAIALGLQAVASDGLHMNSIHLLWPTKPSATTMAPGLVLETWPERQDSHGDAAGKQASRTDRFEGTYVLDTAGLAPLPSFRPGLIPREGTTLRSPSFSLKADSRFLAEIVTVYTDSGSAEVHVTGVGTWKVHGDSLTLNCRWSHSLWKTTEDIRSAGLVTPAGITMRKLRHLDARLFHREGPLHFVRSP